jgi:DNA-binding transcriptional LysR family regulator
VLLAALDAARLSPRIVLELGSREAVRQVVLAGSGSGPCSSRSWRRSSACERSRSTGADLSAVVSLVCLAERREVRDVWAFFAVD